MVDGSCCCVLYSVFPRFYVTRIVVRLRLFREAILVRLSQRVIWRKGFHSVVFFVREPGAIALGTRGFPDSRILGG